MYSFHLFSSIKFALRKRLMGAIWLSKPTQLENRCCHRQIEPASARKVAHRTCRAPPDLVAWRQSRCVLRRKTDIFCRFLFRLGQRFLVVLFGDEDVERRHDEQCEDRSDRHSADECQTDRISRSSARARYKTKR